MSKLCIALLKVLSKQQCIIRDRVCNHLYNNQGESKHILEAIRIIHRPDNTGNYQVYGIIIDYK